MTCVNLDSYRIAATSTLQPVTSLKSKVTRAALTVLTAAVIGGMTFLISSSLPFSLAAGVITLPLLCAWISYQNRTTTPQTEVAPLSTKEKPLPDLSFFNDEPLEAPKKNEPLVLQPLQQPSDEEPEFVHIEKERNRRQLAQLCTQFDTTGLWPSKCSVRTS